MSKDIRTWLNNLLNYYKINQNKNNMKDLIFTAYLVIGHGGHRFVFAINKDDLDTKLLDDEIPVYYIHYFDDSLSGYIQLLVDYLGFEESGDLICNIMILGFYNGRKQFHDITSNSLKEITLPFPLDNETCQKLSIALNGFEIDELVSECLYFGICSIKELDEQIIFNYVLN
jgi:hypothetical protein